MIKETRYTGITAVPSDYDCPDGQLAESFNLLNEDGAMRPLFPPKTLLTLPAGDEIIFVHKTSAFRHYIIADRTTTPAKLYWTEETTDATITLICSVDTLLDINAIGNTLIIASSDGLRYILWKDNKYIDLNDRPPFISIDFGTYKVSTLTDSEDFDVPARCSLHWPKRQGRATDAELAELTQMAFGLLNKNVADTITSNGYFYQPFFVRYAYRLYDGTHSWHSAPILMLPTILPPFIRYTDDGSMPGAEGRVPATLTLDVPYFALTYRILNDAAAQLENWADIITGIDIFVSAPLYTYDQSKDLSWTPLSSISSILKDVNPAFNKISNNASRPGAGNSATGALPSEVFVGHYADSISSRYLDHYMTVDDNTDILAIGVHEKFYTNIQNAHDFYKLAEIPIEEIALMTEMTELKIDDTDLSTLVTRPRLEDDYQSHCKIIASSLYTYNSRLNLSGISLSPAEPFPIRSCMQFGNPEGSYASSVRITVWTRLNGVKVHAVHFGISLSDLFRWYNPAQNFPRYIYYPDASAYKMEIRVSESQKYIINLVAHDFLNGAYYFRGKESMANDPIPTQADAETTDCPTSLHLGAKLYTSEVNNPFFFPVTGINTIGTGNIIGICSAAKALSQGQFGQFPLYAFTDEGVWALEVSSSGGFSARQPITRDVCLSPDSIAQIDSAVLFATNRGIMLISGSQTQCISDVLSSPDYFNVESLPFFKKNFIEFFHPECPFLEYIRNCRIAYDYTNQRIIIFNPDKYYSYVYSLKTKQWGMWQSSLTSVVNSYPEALAMICGQDESYLVDLADTDATSVRCLLVSRPLKFDGPDLLKTIATSIQRGILPKQNSRPGLVTNEMACVLYGTRDYQTWHLVGTSRALSLRTYLGTPYKAFRIVAVATMSKQHSIAGCSFDVIPRFTNRLR
ncbi:MAG: hypothetical protein HDS72_04475 [Bacteroidales bacterium]|nr:hypothetical protein [Bacteroidales bacterium]